MVLHVAMVQYYTENFGPEAFALLNEIAEYTAGIGSVSRKLYMENAMRDLSTTLCQGWRSKS